MIVTIWLVLVAYDKNGSKEDSLLYQMIPELATPPRVLQWPRQDRDNSKVLHASITEAIPMAGSISGSWEPKPRLSFAKYYCLQTVLVTLGVLFWFKPSNI